MWKADILGVPDILIFWGYTSPSLWIIAVFVIEIHTIT